ncbi:hypothetical protein GGR21_003914 [Dysgonomonas hofstadii]|uniref:Carbohydrate-binding domain-containing protein n=1 Tax=Dysgonomonas hofstadii TaxID=637886 RepID=A0A840CUX8_9BACT|nr:carbohydrate-binding family 9-like protein [Dysgonomonas hofstadii]MBB4037988.1 hypothetical protein [Dysgonomonas hofstadii]
MLLVPFIDVSDVDNPDLIKEKLNGIPLNNISCVDWPDQYPSKPDVSFKIAHNGDFLFLRFFVEENEILANVTEDNGSVWNDSCVEFFLSIGDDPYYYNAEFSCIGTALLGYRKGREGAVHASKPVMEQIRRFSSLGADPIKKEQGEFKWDLLVAIPVAAYWNSGLQTFKGLRAKANFYKCGDELTVPHYLSWNPVLTENPDFHVPRFFGEVEFE